MTCYRIGSVRTKVSISYHSQQATPRRQEESYKGAPRENERRDAKEEKKQKRIVSLEKTKISSIQPEFTS